MHTHKLPFNVFNIKLVSMSKTFPVFCIFTTCYCFCYAFYLLCVASLYKKEEKRTPFAADTCVIKHQPLNTGAPQVITATLWCSAVGASCAIATATRTRTCCSSTVTLWPASVSAACTTPPGLTAKPALPVTTETPSPPKTAPVSSCPTSVQPQFIWRIHLI